MSTLADIFRLFGLAYIEKFSDKIPLAHLKVIEDITACRTEALGGQVFYCEHCQQYHYSYHSCGNRHCNKCQNDRAGEWLQEKTNMLLPVSHFLVTFTLPDALRRIARSHQKLFYKLLFKCAAGALQTLAQDFKYLGGIIGMLGILHTWGRELCYHPHVHFIVPGLAYFKEGDALLFAKENFLLPVKAASIIFRAKFRDALNKEDAKLFNSIPVQTWKQDWVVHCENVGSGEAAFKYLANYVFRVAISNNRICKMENGKVSFKYQDSNSKLWKTMTLDALEFMRRFLQHVLPKGFMKVRYYGFWASANKHLLKRIRELLHVREEQQPIQTSNRKTEPMRCPTCQHILIFIAEVKPGGHWTHAPPEKSRFSENGNSVSNV